MSLVILMMNNWGSQSASFSNFFIYHLSGKSKIRRNSVYGQTFSQAHISLHLIFLKLFSRKILILKKKKKFPRKFIYLACFFVVEQRHFEMFWQKLKKERSNWSDMCAPVSPLLMILLFVNACQNYNQNSNSMFVSFAFYVDL